MGEYHRQNLVYEKEDLLIDGQGKYHGYNFYRVAGVDAGVKGKGDGENELHPVDIKKINAMNVCSTCSCACYHRHSADGHGQKCRSRAALPDRVIAPPFP